MAGILAPDEVTELADEFPVASYAGGMCVLREGEICSSVYVVRSGAIELRRTISGRVVTLQLLREGSVFNDAPVLLKQPEPFDACAVEDTTVVVIPATKLFALLNQRPHLAARWLESFAARIADTQHRVGDLLAGTLDAQVSSFLLRMAVREELEISQERLARMFGVRRTSLNQVLRRMEDQGLVELTYRRVRIADRGAMQALLA